MRCRERRPGETSGLQTRSEAKAQQHCQGQSALYLSGADLRCVTRPHSAHNSTIVQRNLLCRRFVITYVDIYAACCYGQTPINDERLLHLASEVANRRKQFIIQSAYCLAFGLTWQRAGTPRPFPAIRRLGHPINLHTHGSSCFYRRFAVT